jgi:AraC-like DNA-binding protein
MSAWDVILVNPGEVHDGRPSGRSGRRYSMLEVDPETHRRMCFDATGRDRVEFERPIFRDTQVSRALSAWLTSLSGTDASRERESSTILLGLVFANRERPRSRCVASELAAKASVRMKESSAGADAIGDLAMEIGVSRYQLIRAFRQAFGLTPEDFRRQLRIERARSALAGHCSLADIAVGCGFSDQSHMTREFRRMTGLTPSAYRRALR